MKINTLSDIHLEFSGMEMPNTDADVVILAGDIALGTDAIGWAKQMNKPVIYVAGNHEFYNGNIDIVRKSIKLLSKNTNIHFLDDEEVVIDGVRFLGATLWTDFNLFGKAPLSKLHAMLGMNDYRLIKITDEMRKLRPDETEKLHSLSLKFLKLKLSEPFEGKTVVVTHHAPSINSIAKEYLHDKITPAYASDLEYLMGDRIALWVHGHVHISNDYNMNGTRVITNPRGYQYEEDPSPQNKEFNPNLVVEL